MKKKGKLSSCLPTPGYPDVSSDSNDEMNASRKSKRLELRGASVSKSLSISLVTMPPNEPKLMDELGKKTILPVKANLDRRNVSKPTASLPLHIESETLSDTVEYVSTSTASSPLHIESQQIRQERLHSLGHDTSETGSNRIEEQENKRFSPTASSHLMNPQISLPKTMAQVLSESTSVDQRPKPVKKVFKSSIPAFPGKDQAVLFQAEEGVLLSQYLRAMADEVGGKNIIFASRMSQGRLCFYLSSRQLVDKFMTERGGISIEDRYFSARRLVTPAERLVISNVCPSIPHKVLETKLSLMVNLISPMNFITLGVKENDLGHILSFRRQIYVIKNDKTTVPDSILIDFDGENHRIFLSFDDITCYKCKKAGHIARSCPNANKEAHVLKGNGVQVSVTADNVVPVVVKDTMQKQDLMKKNNNEKLSEVISFQPINVQPSSAVKSISQEIPEEALALLGSEKNAHVLKKTELLMFLAEVKGNDRPLSVAKKYTENVPGLLLMLDIISPGIKSIRSLRERVRRLKTTLTKAHAFNEATGGDAGDSDISLSRSVSCESLNTDHLV